MRITVLLTLVLGLGITGAFALGAEQESDLSINLTNLAQQTSFGLKDSIVLDFQVINSGTTPVGVFAKLGMGYQGGVILHVLDSTGAEIEPQSIAHDFLDLATVKEPQNYFELQPHQFFGTRQEFAVSELVKKPGHYKLLAEYHSPVDPKYAKVGNFWGINRKSVVSREVEFDVQ